MSKQIAIIRNPHFGVGDYGKVALSFETYISENTAALQVFDGKHAIEIIEGYGVNDVSRLEGRPCWVEVDGVLIRWVGPFKL